MPDLEDVVRVLAAFPDVIDWASDQENSKQVIYLCLAPSARPEPIMDKLSGLDISAAFVSHIPLSDDGEPDWQELKAIEPLVHNPDQGLTGLEIDHSLDWGVRVIGRTKEKAVIEGPKLLDSPYRSLADAFEYHNEARLTVIDSSGSEKQHSLGTIGKKARELSKRLCEYTERGTRVFLHWSNISEFFVQLWACLLTERVPAILPRSDSPNYKDTHRGARELLGDLPSVVPNSKLDTYSKAQTEGELIILFTSGSSGRPKAVPLSEANILAMIEGTRQSQAFDSSDVTLNWMPQEHVGAVVFLHFMAVHLGCHQIHADTNHISSDPVRWLLLLERYRASISWAPNFAFSKLVQQSREVRYAVKDLSRLAFLVNAGEANEAATMAKFQRLLSALGAKPNVLRPAFGMSETCSGITWSQGWRNTGHLAVSLGPPIPGASIRIKRKDGEIAQEGEPGLIQLKGPSVIQAYLNAEQLNKDRWTKEWFETGDIGFVWNGELFVSGRAKDEVVVNGVNIALAEIERKLREAGVHSPVVFQTSDSNESLSLLFDNAGQPSEMAALRASRAFQSVVRKSPYAIYCLNGQELPRTGLGKLRREEVRNKAKHGLYARIDIRHLFDRVKGASKFFNLSWSRRRLKAQGDRPLPNCYVSQNLEALAAKLGIVPISLGNFAPQSVVPQDGEKMLALLTASDQNTGSDEHLWALAQGRPGLIFVIGNSEQTGRIQDLLGQLENPSLERIRLVVCEEPTLTRQVIINELYGGSKERFVRYLGAERFIQSWLPFWGKPKELLPLEKSVLVIAPLRPRTIHLIDFLLDFAKAQVTWICPQDIECWHPRLEVVTEPVNKAVNFVFQELPDNPTSWDTSSVSRDQTVLWLNNTSSRAVLLWEEIQNHPRTLAFLIPKQFPEESFAAALLEAVSQNRSLAVTSPAPNWERPTPLSTFGPTSKDKPANGFLSSVWLKTTGSAPRSEQTFFEAGGDSLSLLEAFTLLSHRYPELKMTDLAKYPSFRELESFLQRSQIIHPKPLTPKKRAAMKIAVIGMSCEVPGASSIDEFWNNLLAGRESIKFLSARDIASSRASPEWTSQKGYVKAAAPLDEAEFFDGEFFGISNKDAKLMDPQLRRSLQCAWHTFERAGYNPLALRETRVSVFAGSALNTYLLNNVLPNRDALAPLGALNPVTLDSLSGFQVMAHNDKDYLPSRIAYHLNLKGPAICVQSACSTGLLAVAMAAESLVAGECDMALAGAVSIKVPQLSGYPHIDGMITSPDGHCRPFDAQAEGTVFGNGLGFVLLKPLDKAQEDGDQVLAVIRGVGTNNDGMDKLSYTSPGELGQTDAALRALNQAGFSADSVGFLESHGTGTKIGDPIEFAALSSAYAAQDLTPCWLGALKANVGHLQIASGIVGFMKAVKVVQDGVVPPSVNYREPNPAISMENSRLRVPPSKSLILQQRPRRAGVNSLGIGGTNVHVVLEEAPETSSESCEGHLEPLITISAPNLDGLERLKGLWYDFLRTDLESSLADIAYTSNLGRVHHRYRIAFFPQREELARAKLGEESELLFHFDVGPPTQQDIIVLQEHSLTQDWIERFNKTLDHLGVSALRSTEPSKLRLVDNFCYHYLTGHLLDHWKIPAAAYSGTGVGLLACAALAKAIHPIDALTALVRSKKRREPSQCSLGESLRAYPIFEPGLPIINSLSKISVSNDWVDNLEKETNSILSEHSSHEYSVTRFGSPESKNSQLAECIKAAYLAGKTIDWSGVHPSGCRCIVPAYPFARTRHWLEPPKTSLSNSDEPASSPNSTTALVISLVSSFLPGAEAELDLENSIFDLGLDSLDAVELKEQLEQSLGLSLDHSLLFDAPPLQLLIERLNELTAKRDQEEDSPGEKREGTVPIPDYLEQHKILGFSCVPASYFLSHLASLRACWVDEMVFSKLATLDQGAFSFEASSSKVTYYNEDGQVVAEAKTSETRPFPPKVERRRGRPASNEWIVTQLHQFGIEAGGIPCQVREIQVNESSMSASFEWESDVSRFLETCFFCTGYAMCHNAEDLVLPALVKDFQLAQDLKRGPYQFQALLEGSVARVQVKSDKGDVLMTCNIHGGAAGN